MTGLVEGKVVVVTGAGRGIGRVIAHRFVAEGAKVLVSDFTGDQNTTAGELGDDAVGFQADVTREEEIEAMFAAATAAFGRVDASIHAAGNPGGKWSDEITVEESGLLRAGAGLVTTSGRAPVASRPASTT